MINIWLWFTLITGIIVFIVLLSQVLYLLLFSILGRFYKENKNESSSTLNRFIIYIPAYKEDSVILKTALKAISLNYPRELFQVVIIADSLKQETLQKLRLLSLQVIEVVFEKSTKVKALNKALEQTKNSFDYAIIFDADNIANPDYLYRMNDAFNNGYKVVQGHRTAKNQDTPIAILDAISEAINNHIFRKGHRVAGLSSAIIGSGMGLAFELYKEVITNLTAVGGFDKEMELTLLKNRITIGFANSALIYDEKVQKTEVFEKQRKRWLSAQLNFLRRHLISGIRELLWRRNFDYFDKVLQMALIPRVMLLAILPVAFMASLLPGNAPSPMYWLMVWITGYIAIILAVPSSFLNRKLIVALTRLPIGIFLFFKVLFKIKGANKTFIHTPHGDVSEKT